MLSAGTKLGDGGACCLAVILFQVVHVKEDTNLVPSSSVASAVILSTTVRGSCVLGGFILTSQAPQLVEARRLQVIGKISTHSSELPHT